MVTLNISQYNESPFPHFSCEKVFDDGVGNSLLNWFEQTDSWSLTENDFYTQYEFSLLDRELPGPIKCLTEKKTTDAIRTFFEKAFDVNSLVLVGVTAHKLIDGHRMGVHNDFIGKDESHRLIIQINENWTRDNGGFLMLLNSKDPQDVSKIIQPIHNSAIGFEISPYSYHAVSAVHDFSRYTLVYTFSRS